MRSTRRARRVVALCWLVPAMLWAGSLRADAMKVEQSGVGTEVVERELRGQADSFAEGTQVWFWTRVVGGNAGDRILHVWLQDGKEKLVVELDIGGSHWRTHSHKQLHAGSMGQWAVEARTPDGEVLARQEFACGG